MVTTAGTTHRPYSARRAWRIASVYFATGIVLGAVTGALGDVFDRPILGHGSWSNTTFVLWMIGCIVLEVVAYGVIWPLGTLTHGRPRRVGWQLGFGLTWGVCESLVFLSIVAIIDWFTDTRWIVAVASFVVISAFTGIWHDKFWDIHVAPEHNIIEWNLRKVLLCHIPNLCATLPFLVVYRAPVLFIVFQTISLTLSTWFMRFPAPDWVESGPIGSGEHLRQAE